MKIKSRIQALMKSGRCGFTLVELIVVLVILAILAALLIPSLTGYIDKAQEQQLIIQTRQAVMAAQALFNEAYGAGICGKEVKDVLTISIGSDELGDKIYELAELDSTKGTLKNVATDSTGKISTLTWQLTSDKGNGDRCEYNAGNTDEPYKVIHAG